MSHPAPLTPCRPANEAEIPTTAARLIREATATGWTAKATYAHGTSTDARGAPSRLVESLAVRLQREPLAAVAVWHDGKFATAYVWSRFTAPCRIAARDLSRFVKASA